MKKLDPNCYDRIDPLIAELAAFNVAIPALLNGINPGRVFVDDPDSPQTAFIETVEGRHLVGDPANDVFITALHAHIGDALSDYGIAVTTYPEAWVDRLPEVFYPRTVGYVTRRHYICTALKYDHWREHLPDNFSVRPISADLLDNPTLDIPEHILRWIRSNWGAQAQYERYGFGFCTLHGEKIVSWSLADCVSGTRAEIGIRTRPDYQRQGLAAITAAACVEYALANGFDEVGWHCDAENIGSWKTAEKVGFHHERDYMLYYSQ